uniref:ATP synthase F0 subunit 8 n=1 Tax=Tenodera angustipennis TaxID=62740 RepID=UPI001C323570|nr:ATP synthase F0 subunit 8 [Tenodera angustipennis]ASY98356.1 ATP synthase F0 subunit 8 [Tenodera angustipennis]UUF67518.1 ATP synthase F0 subunit 8 [Tenodera angustipennis]
MPQMMPLNWLTLFFFFSILLILFNVMNYYSSFNKASSRPLMKLSSKTLTWKW